MEEQASVGAAGSSAHRDPDEINLLEYLYVIVHRKWLIIGLTLVGVILGLVAAVIKGPTWDAEVLIAPKESDTQKAPSFAGLGALGGLVASQLNIGGNASLDKIDLIIDSREFNAQLVEKDSLLPDIYKNKYRKAYKKLWDAAQGKWKAEFEQPKFLDMGGMLKGYLKKVTNKNNTMTIRIQSRDSTFSINLANKYIAFLNDYIKTNVQSDAKENVDYLEKQLDGIADPLLREKLQSLIADEIEKEMVVSKEAFRVVDPVYMSKTFKEKKLFPLVFGFGLFFLSSLLAVFVHALSSSDKTEEDKKLLEKIRKEILFIKS
jgi:LPS O-antigen subunit length determinant protein (WzzB/FepE family)